MRNLYLGATSRCQSALSWCEVSVTEVKRCNRWRCFCPPLASSSCLLNGPKGSEDASVMLWAFCEVIKEQWVLHFKTACASCKYSKKTRLSINNFTPLSLALGCFCFHVNYRLINTLQTIQPHHHHPLLQ